MSNSTDNTKELDSYGVWVKRAPQDASEEALDLDLPDFSDFDVASDAKNTGTESEEVDADADIEIPDEKTAEISVDDFVTDGFSDPNEGLSSSEENEISLDDFMDSSVSETETASSGSSTDEISLDDFLDDISSDSPSKGKEDDISNDEPLDINVDFDQPEEEAVPTTEISTEDDSAGTAEDEDIFYPTEEAAAEPAAEQPEGEEKTSFELEEVSLDDFNLEESDDATAAALGASINSAQESAGEDVSLSSLGFDENSEENSGGLNEAPKTKTVDYELAITEDDTVKSAPVINEIKTDSDSKDKEESSKTSDVSNELLEKIVSDLSGLKNEINSLKNDLADLKEKKFSAVSSEEQNITHDTNDGTEYSAGIEDEEEQMYGQETDGGFFNNNEEDDTIALSGDELSNIMNNADFTEETSGQPDFGQDENKQSEDSDTDLSEDIPESENSGVLPAETIAEDKNTEIPDTLDESLNTENEFSSDFSTDTPFGDINEADIPDEEHDSGLSIDINEDVLEEPNLDGLEDNSDIPQEIEIPKTDAITENEEPAVDDIIVESSATDLMNSVTDSTNQEPVIDDIQEPEVMEETSTNTSEPDDIAVEDIAIPAEPKQFETLEEAKNVQDAIMNDIMSETPSVQQDLSEENVDYLSEDQAVIESDSAETTEPDGIQEPAAEPEETEYKSDLPADIKSDVKSVLLYMDQLLENLPEEKIMEFAKSEQFTTYKKLFNELGLS